MDRGVMAQLGLNKSFCRVYYLAKLDIPYRATKYMEIIRAG